mmetsp:Transcript_1522/g.5213  ORF Transcript_1522/g.5213 Transcript_1522/m.5213 type:complete len:882 (-) Transcript_1522:1362-4007(-)|eukprot:CAMPEP_0117449640 /NCGR_PEP_ID=MMETSP0759-20121206/8048_1 /TAXON_ID=63605 /ORGANISM="Percolomonas cosmopolitus, Strain WS" /LENGTH=881 /DNA_ID=CAMNT_0005242119 /DNA_START=261 /DNA_END=2906 /DNA_ORIENTATION=-
MHDSDASSIDSIYNQGGENSQRGEFGQYEDGRREYDQDQEDLIDENSQSEGESLLGSNDDDDNNPGDYSHNDNTQDNDDLLSDARSHTGTQVSTSRMGTSLHGDANSITDAHTEMTEGIEHGTYVTSSSYVNLLRKDSLNGGSFNSLYGNMSDLEYSDEDTFSHDDDRFEESFLVQQQKKVAFDFRKQEDHENALKEMYLYMKATSKQRKVSKKVKGLVSRMFRRFSDVILSHDKFWRDMVYIVLNYFQIAGLLWIYPYVMPPNVYTFTQWTIYFNFDFISHREGHTNLVNFGLDNPPFYPFYLTPWLIIPPLLFTFWLVMPWFRSFPVIRKCYYELDRIIFTLLRMLYLPFLLHTWAGGFCGSQGQSAFQCAAFCPDEFGWCLTRSLPAFVASAYYAVGVPLAFCYQARKLIVYARNTKHMNYMGNVEVEKALRISNNYVMYRLYMISSYTRLGSYYVFIKEAVQKATMVFFWAVLDGRDDEGYYSWRSQVAISSFTFAVMILPLVMELFWRPYRNLSYFMLTQMLGWVHVCNVMLAWFLALEVRSPFLLASQLTILILMVNATVLVVVFGMLTFMILMRVKWPINDRVVQELETKYAHYLKSIRNGYMLYAHSLTTNPSFVRCDLLFYHKEYMQKLYQEAALENNPLEETIEDCILKLEEEYYANQNLTFMPHKGLQSCLPTLRRNMDRRQTEMILIPPRKRILLMKLLALRKIIGNQPLKRFKVGEAPTTPDLGDEDEDDKSEESVDLSSMDKLQAFLAQYDIHLSESDDEEERENSDKEDDDIDRLLDEASVEYEQETSSPPPPATQIDISMSNATAADDSQLQYTTTELHEEELLDFGNTPAVQDTDEVEGGDLHSEEGGDLLSEEGGDLLSEESG